MSDDESIKAIGEVAKFLSIDITELKHDENLENEKLALPSPQAEISSHTNVNLLNTKLL